jgi:hypothetical protein
LFRGSSAADDVDNGIGKNLLIPIGYPKTQVLTSPIYLMITFRKVWNKVKLVGVFTSKSVNVASDYGKPYIFFLKENINTIEL